MDIPPGEVRRHQSRIHRAETPTARRGSSQFDSPSYPAGRTAAVDIATKLFWALGYNQVETFITTFDPARVDDRSEGDDQRPSGERTPFTRDDIDAVLERAARNADGTYRSSAGRLLPGKVLGAFRYGARARTIRTTSCRTSTAASCARCASSARGRT